MIAVEDAVACVVAGFAPLPAETLGLAEALGRVLAHDLIARVSQPPVAVSAMDGYAVRTVDVASVPATLRVIGEAAAGRGHQGTVGAGEAVRIFTGAPVPEGADAVVIQEDTRAEAAQRVILRALPVPGRHIRPAGGDFPAGAVVLAAGTRLGPAQLGLAAAANHPWLAVRRRPRVAILATGDELALPGEPLPPAGIVASAGFAVAGYVRAFGGRPISLGIARDCLPDLTDRLAAADGVDLLVTIGGVSVGDHDLVGQALGTGDFEIAFHKVAMRPGKPLLFGRFGHVPVIGLPGNPVSACVTALLFVRPAIARMLGRVASDPPRSRARLATSLPANDARQDYLRAHLAHDSLGDPVATPLPRQDSAGLAAFATANALIVRAPHAPAAVAGEEVGVLPLDPASMMA